MEVYVLPQQVLSPIVTVEEENNELIMSAADYQIICDEMMLTSTCYSTFTFTCYIFHAVCFTSIKKMFH